MATPMKRAFSMARMAAFMAAVAVLLQAIAIPSARAEVIEVCTAHGIEKVLVKGDAGPAMPGDCEHCGHCVLIVPADLPRAASAAPVRYAARAEAPHPLAAPGGLGARAPPRPPGQGPPDL